MPPGSQSASCTSHRIGVEDEARKKGHMDSLTEDAEGYVVATAVGYLRNVVYCPQELDSTIK